MKATVSWTGKACFSGKAESGHEVIMDGPPDGGGENQGVRPMEMLLLGMGGCTAFDVMHILAKARQNVSACSVVLEAQRADKPPRVFTRIHAHFKLAGMDLDARHVERAIALSAEKYCSASIMLGKSATITHDWEITGSNIGANRML